MSGVKVCVRCTLLTTHNISLHSEASSWSPQSSAAAPLASDSAQHHEASLQCLKKKTLLFVALYFPKVFFLPIVPAFLWCALVPAPVPSLQALLMLLDMEEGRLASSPPDRDSKLLCMNLSLRPTWSTLSMLNKKNRLKSFIREKLFSCVVHEVHVSRESVISLNPASPFPGYDRKVLVFPHVHPPNSHVYDYFPIAKAIIQVPPVSQQSVEVLCTKFSKLL